MLVSGEMDLVAQLSMRKREVSVEDCSCDPRWLVLNGCGAKEAPKSYKLQSLDSNSGLGLSLLEKHELLQLARPCFAAKFKIE